MNGTKALLSAGLCAYATVLAFAGMPDKASANERRTHSSICHYYYDNAGTSLSNASSLYNGTSSRSIYCPVISDSTIAHSNTLYLNVHGRNTVSGTSYSRACTKNAWNTASNCGTQKTWVSTTGGMVAESVDVSIWQAEFASFPYLYNYMQAGTYLYGFWMAN